MKPRILHAITVYNGRAFVPAAIDSALRMDQTDAEVDVLILDDASPEPGFSEAIQAYCDAKGALYYRTPRNLGIPRNVNLGLMTAVSRGYDYVTINNSDVLFPKNLISVMLKAFEAENVGSVTAWSNNVSIYSVPNADPDQYLSNQETVDFVSETFADLFGTDPLDIPAGISFCIMMPVSVIRTVGVMDPIFGRGYCEETDWSLRSLKAGFRICLAPGAFVYHMGRGSNLAAGLVSAHHTTVPENEAVIDMRHPTFRTEVLAFERAGDNDRLKDRAIKGIVSAAAARHGYVIELGWGRRSVDVGPDVVRVRIMNDGPTPSISYAYRGFEHATRIPEGDVTAEIAARFQGRAALVNLYDPLDGKGDGEASGQDAGSYPMPFWVSGHVSS